MGASPSTLATPLSSQYWARCTYSVLRLFAMFAPVPPETAYHYLSRSAQPERGGKLGAEVQMAGGECFFGRLGVLP